MNVYNEHEDVKDLISDLQNMVELINKTSISERKIALSFDDQTPQNTNDISSFLEIKKSLYELKEEVKLFQAFIPDECSIAFLAEKTGRCKASISNILERHYREGADYFKRKNRIIVKRKCLMNVIATHTKESRHAA